MKYCSQHGQDKWVIDILNGKRGGFYLDTGAYEPITDSNTYALQLYYGWSGIGVEPSAALCKAHNFAREGSTVINAILSDSEGEVNWIEAYGLSGIMEHITGSDRDRLTSLLGAPLESHAVKLPATTLAKVLEQHNAPEHIDYWSLDVEGAELMLLQTFPWDKHTVGLLTVEHNGIEPKRSQTQAFLTEKNFRCIPNMLCPWEDHYIHATTI